MDALVAEDVRKAYGERTALDGVSLSVPPGEVFGLIGPNGAGKTTLVRALTGTTDVEGRVRTLGVPPADVDPERVGLLPQAFSPAARLTARELLAYYAGLYDDPRDVGAVLDDVGLTDDADVRFERLSGGQRRRLCVGTALVNGPDVLFLDEPTTGIDPAGRRALWALLEELAEAGATVFLTSHSMPEVERLADRVGLLADGRLLAVGSPGDLVAAHGGDPRLLVTPAGPPAGVVEALSAAGFDAAVDDGDGEVSVVVRGATLGDVGAVVDALDAAGVDADSLVWQRPDLEDVYLALAGDGGGR
jgi:ABC-2 type transport system ATP-binding protein